MTKRELQITNLAEIRRILDTARVLRLGLVLHMDYIGFWLGDALAGFTPLWIGLVYYFSGSWKTRKYVIKEEKA